MTPKKKTKPRKPREKMKTIAQIKKMKHDYDKLRREIARAEKQLSESELPALRKKHVGTYLKYRNSYSCPQGPEDYWWVYGRVTDVSGYGDFVQFEMETVAVDKYGTLRVEKKERAGGGWVESSGDEFRGAVKQALRCLLDMEYRP